MKPLIILSSTFSIFFLLLPTDKTLQYKMEESRQSINKLQDISVIHDISKCQRISGLIFSIKI
jgi:hypothetical protein